MRKYFPALSAICIKQSVNALCGQRDCHLKLRLMCNCKVIATPKVFCFCQTTGKPIYCTEFIALKTQPCYT